MAKKTAKKSGALTQSKTGKIHDQNFALLVRVYNTEMELKAHRDLRLFPLRHPFKRSFILYRIKTMIAAFRNWRNRQPESDAE